VLAILAWLIVPYTATAYLSVTYVARNAEQAALWVNIVGVALLALALWAVIPRWGLLGTAWAVVLVEAVQAALFIIISIRWDAVASLMRRVLTR
jgi:O-antigen/teichoic acid export membrane protein